MISPGHKAYNDYREVLSTYDIGSPAWNEIGSTMQAVWEKFAEKTWEEVAA